jgi:hypothetical protein
MKHLTRTIAITLVTVVAMTACKTTESNYRNAYERTVNHADSTRTEFEQTIYGKYRRQMRDVAMRIDGDTVQTKAQRVTVTKDVVKNAVTLRRYNVVVGEFKQLFNAKSMCERLIEGGHSDAFVVQTAEPYYFVIIGSFNKGAEAVACRDAIAAKPPFKLKDGLPFILQASQLM